jgi:endonuclease/exonuclease/phosphatase family metal-dependent hydrolase
MCGDGSAARHEAAAGFWPARSLLPVLALAGILGCSAAITASPTAVRPVAAAVPEPGDVAADSLTVRVLVYNIHAGKDAGGVHNLARVAEVVRDARADIVLLQEVDRGTRRSGGEDQPAILGAATEMHAAFGSTLDYQGGEYGIAVLSRWPISADTLIRLPVTPAQERSGGSREPRGALRVRVATPAGAMLVINTHLDPGRDDRWRRQEAEAVRDLALGAADGAVAVLVGGDFNSTPESAVQVMLTSSGLRDSWLECGSGDGFTFSADSAVKRIDYLYIIGDGRCRSAEVLATKASDHRPLLVETSFARRERR